jgi:GNAT superfamily N-acetyltransferase
VQPLDAVEARELGETLPDTPFLLTARCLLLRGTGVAWSARPIRPGISAVVRAPWLPTEPMALGEDAEALWELLREIPGWDCVNLPKANAADLARVLERELGQATRTMEDLYYRLDTPARSFTHPSVRRLREADLGLVEDAPVALQPVGYSSLLAALAGGIVAGSVEDGRLVGMACMDTSSAEYANVGVQTLEGWRDQGRGTASASLVAAEAQARDLTPIWSTGPLNHRSQRVAEKIGFRECGREAYVIVPALQASGGFRPAPAGGPGDPRAQS